MFFAVILGLLALAVAFFHYLQGFFSAALSAIFAVIAAVFAFSYHETVVESLLGGRMADSAHAAVLLVMFAVIYLALRIVFDNFIPGNVRLPSVIDKVGAAIMGVIAGVFATGIIAIAAQELPFAQSIGGYSRYAVAEDRSAAVPGEGYHRAQDSKVFAEIPAKAPGEWGEPQSLILPVDDLVVGAVQKLSSPGGSLEAGKPLNQVHPNFLQEVFGNRLGIETGAGRVTQKGIDLVGLFTANIPPDQQADPEFKEIRGAAALQPIKLNKDEMFLVVRLMFHPAAEDPDGMVRLSPATCRLVAPKGGRGEDEQDWTDYYPIGTLDNASKLYLNKIDDYLFVTLKEGEKGADLVYRLPKSEFEKQAPPGSFLEIKRLERFALGGKAVSANLKPDPNIAVMRKTFITNPPEEEQPATPPKPPPAAPAAGGRGQPQPGPAGASQSAFKYSNIEASSMLPVPIKVNPGQDTKPLKEIPGGSAVLKNAKAASLNVDSTLAEQSGGALDQFSVPDGQAMVRVSGSVPQWTALAEPEQFEVVDSTGKRYQPNGILVHYAGTGGQRIHYAYSEQNTISGLTQPEKAGAPADVSLFYLVPQNVTIAEFDDHQQKVQATGLTATRK